ncbi:hypothetical protein LUZ62_045366 [Rhynchospora pubera]|uniref:RNase H type-1 domain-containing protein n=1 Tax=Rhynchospora pubera TaxID=906938 RepID=A0AAV8FKT2_9POAL|nr:hypothetical protein LUZ62_045366 [Rhynchospora pubera]
MVQMLECWIDASWVHNGQQGTGMAFAIFHAGTLVRYQLEPTESTSPFHAELKTLIMAIHELARMGITDCCFYTDCKELQQLINDETCISTVEWQTFHDENDIVVFWNCNKYQNWYCAHISREGNFFVDGLARYAMIRNVQLHV